MSWTYVEPCCGAASIALALRGARRPLLPYQGAKWRFRRVWRRVAASAGYTAPPAAIVLGDVGPWGTVAPLVLGPQRGEVIRRLELLDEADARATYDSLHKHPVPDDPVQYAAEFLFLQRLAYSGKAVGDPHGRWASPGFNSSSAYGLAGTARFGQVNPMVPSLLRVLRSYDDLLPIPTTGARGPALAPTRPAPDTLVYLDPPYANSTRYPMGDLGRAGLVELAVAWHEAGATVIISEGEPVAELVAEGWRSTLLDAGRQDTSRFRGKQPEFLTLSPPSALSGSGPPAP